jgi:uncharacterized RDD family membrane protein YckC
MAPVKAPETVLRIPAPARRFQGEHAGIVARFIAAAIDLAVVIGLIAALYAAIFGISFILRPRHPHWPELGWSLPAALFIIAVPYLTFSWITTGRSRGNALLGTRVVNRRGRRVGLLLALTRAIICVVFPVGLFWCVVSRKKRAVHDVLLRTAVIHDWQHTVPR